MLIRDLAWVVSLAEQQNVTDAAAVLGTSQPTLSRVLARVEAELGTRLFERTPTGVVTTPAGQIVLGAARAITDRHDQLVADLQSELDPDAGVVRLAFLDSLATSLVPQVLRTFHRQAPRVRVVLRQEPNHEILADLRSGAVDLAITSPRPEGAFGWRVLQEERLVLVVPPTHRLRHRRQVDLAEISDDELVTIPVGYGFRTLVDSLLRDAGSTPTISFESQDLATIEGLVAAGLGVGLVPEPFAGQSGTVGLRITSPAARRTLGLTWRNDRDLSAPADRFRDLVTPQRDRARPSSG